MPKVLGLNFGHDGAAAVVDEGRLVAAISNERISRVKKAVGVTPAMIEYVLGEAGCALSEIDRVALSSYLYSPGNFVKVLAPNGSEVQQHLIDLFGGETHRECHVDVGGRRIPAVFVQHHIAHCASAYYTSPFDRAACFSVDASHRHPEACSLFAYGEGTELRYLYCPGVMIGNAYDLFTDKLGIGPGLTKAGTTMGLAPYSAPAEWSETEWSDWGASFYDRRFQANDYLFILRMWSRFSGLPPHGSFTHAQSDSKEAMHIAATLQRVFEKTLLSFASRLCSETAAFAGGNLCLSGGSFLNSETNMLIKRSSGFERVHLFPGCGDDGTAVGAALFCAHHVMKTPRSSYSPRDIMYLGKYHKLPAAAGRPAEEYRADDIAGEIADGKVVAWFQGRSEFGPRALGNRSILADPRRADMRDRLNARVKRREWYRPFAPSVLAEEAGAWFDMDGASPFMLLIANARKAGEIPSAVHVDGSARVQTVDCADNPRYHELISAFAKKTGVPMLINTSLNGNNEPLVETPDDALRLFESTEIDVLVFVDNDRGVVFRK